MKNPLNELLTAFGQEAVVPIATGTPSFSVLIRTQGRRPRSLAEALESVANQSHSVSGASHGVGVSSKTEKFPRAETLLIVHGNVATQRSVEASLENANLPEEFKVLLAKGGNRGRPLNVGIEHAKGDYFCVLDDDDLVEPNWLTAFARGVVEAPGTIIRAVTKCQDWTTEGGNQPVRPTSDPHTPFANKFDFLAHMHHNETPGCAVAFPLAGVLALGLRYDETLPVFEDWDFLMRAAMAFGVTSIEDATSLYRRLDAGNAFTAHNAETWQQTYEKVQEKLWGRAALLPGGVAMRVALAEFLPCGGPRQQTAQPVAASAADPAVTDSVDIDSADIDSGAVHADPSGGVARPFKVELQEWIKQGIVLAKRIPRGLTARCQRLRRNVRHNVER